VTGFFMTRFLGEQKRQIVAEDRGCACGAMNFKKRLACSGGVHYYITM